MDLEHQRILITGASLGLGRAVAEACVKGGASVVISARTEAPLQQAREELEARAAPGVRVIAHPADVAHAADVEALIAAADAELDSLDGVVCCAGVYGPIGRFEEVDWEAWVQALHINLLGTVLVCRGAVPLLRRAGGGSIVTLSGGGATAPLPRFTAYGASKAAVVRLAETLSVELADDDIAVNAVAPGALNTRLLDEVLEAGPERAGAMHGRAVEQAESGGASLERAAELCALLLAQRAGGVTGRLISAPWDPWEQLPDHAEALRGSDVYTLRRIVPEDRPDVAL